MSINTQSQETALEINEFYRDNYRRTMKWLSLMVVICAILTALLTWMTYGQKQSAYYGAMTTGQIIPMHALSEPVVTSDFILQWSSLAARRIYNLNFASYQQELNVVKDKFSQEGWEKMMNALTSSGMIKQLVGSRLIISSVISGPPVIIARMIVDHRFTWHVQMPLLVTYTSSNQTRKRRILVTMTIQRVATLDASQGIQIVDFSAG